MPVKGAGKLGCYVINPLSNHKNESRRKQLIDIYDSQIDGDKLDIWLKRQNTLSFLHSGNEICAEYYAVYDMFMKGIERIIEHINY